MAEELEYLVPEDGGEKLLDIFPSLRENRGKQQEGIRMEGIAHTVLRGQRQGG